ncbi:response regulator [Cyclobacterium qasimii]|uniref:Response regulator n=2 Tax=Cyclobacterium qasimii TaxID=1350429 RepID=S7VMZ5_9BACT|nr:response regulator [Cyclobacterium qasimii]EPR71321.1 response regulator [Cyclobacterium qasimii M12-11B]GEO20503.1 hypothetical protein CQA01_10370 [Cyclobacterium qasimii]
MEPIRIFIADDDRDDREIFLEGLEKLPIDKLVSQFDNGVELMKGLHANSQLPDAIYLDLYMPLQNGFECLTDIREVPEFSDIKIIIYSTTYNHNVVDLLKENGANQYIQKPISFSHLKTLLNKSMKSIMETKTDPSLQDQFFVML